MYIPKWIENIEPLPANNELASWTPYFERIGVSIGLLAASFNEEPLPNFKNLYLSCFVISRISSSVGSDLFEFESWQLYLLSTEPRYLTKILSDEFSRKKDFSGRNLLHYAAWSGSPEAITAVLTRFPELAKMISNRGLNLLLYAALSGSPEAITTVLTRFPELAKTISNKGLNLLHCAAASDSRSPEAIITVLTRFPELAETVSKSRSNFLHFMLCSTNSLPDPLISLKRLITTHPALVKKLWVKKNKWGETPDSLASAWDKRITLQTVLRKLFQETLESLSNETAALSLESLTFLEAFREEWLKYLTENGDNNPAQAAVLLRAIDGGKLGPTLSTYLSGLKKVLSLKAIPVLNETLNKSQLTRLLEAAKEALPVGTNSPLLSKLNHYSRSIAFISGDTLTPEALKTLNLIIDDYHREPAYQATQAIDRVLISALCSTKTVTLSRPRPIISTGLDLQVGNFKTHLDTLKTDFSALSASEETRRIITTIIFPGIEHLIDHEEEIITHFREHYGVLYYLVPNLLPLHTDHVSRGDAEGFRRTLHQLVKDFIGGAYLAKGAGQLSGYFGRFTGGYCIEGRSRDALRFAVDHSETKPFLSLMEKAIYDYQAFQKIMLGKTGVEIENLGDATKFILERYQSLACRRDEHYAPDSKVTEAGVRAYLTEVFSYDDEVAEKTEALKLLDKKINSLTSSGTSLFSRDERANAKRDALIILRFALVNAGATPLAAVIEQWKTAKTPSGETNDALIKSHRFSLPWQRTGAPTATETVVADIIASAAPAVMAR